ncbi:MAG TPA: GFA family protein [Croceibacterium sp.]|nr:GFA family protein [Croceibacterium sp.]
MSEAQHSGSCHCGKVRLTLCDDPFEAAECNCSMCRRHGGLWHYSHPDRVAVEGEGVSYRQGDCMLDLWHCPTCACTTHWTSVDPGYPRMGINLRMFEPELWQDLPRRFVDGASY